jgi:serine/threonine-protein kinase
VHRDVSPQNILVGVDGIPRLLDFGIAKARGTPAQARRAARSRASCCTWSPEQLRQWRARSARATCTALRRVLWEVLAGRPLFERAERVGHRSIACFTTW